MSNRSCSGKRFALVGMLTWFSSHQHNNNSEVFVDAARRISNNGPSIQHRVKRSHRTVGYTHAANGGVRRNVRSRSTSTGGTPETNDEPWELRKEIHPEDVFWVFHASTNNNRNNGAIQQEQQQQSHEDTLGTRRSLLRYLYDQFVGEELPPSNNLGSGTTKGLISGNLSTGVEFENIEEANPGAVYHQPEISSTFNNDVTATTTTTTGDGNSTESVVYTTSTEDLAHANNNDPNTGRFDDSTIVSEILQNNNKSNNNNNNGSIVDVNDTIADHNSTNSTTTADHADPQFQPLRMRAILAEDNENRILLNDTEREILFHELLSPALLAWSSSLRVDPVVGKLTVDNHQLVDGATCGPGVDSGLPSIKVPTTHIEEGIPDTDMIVYLSLGFTVPGVGAEMQSGDENDNGNNYNETDALYYDTINPNPGSFDDDDDDDLTGDGRYRQKPFGLSENDRKSELNGEELGGRFGEKIKNYVNGEEPGGDRRGRHLTAGRNGDEAAESVSSTSTSTSTSAMDNTETNGTAPINICTGEYLAAASYCSTDQFDRPTAALLHICIDDSFFEPRHRRRNIMTLVHELGHALGFNALSMAHFRRPDGTPYTARDKDGDVPDTTIECTGPEDELQTATLPLPSEDILKFRNVRGGVRVAEIVTPSVLRVVRNQFDCQLLTGAELESSEGSPLSISGEGAGCIGDHWERRLFSSDVMNPIVDDIEYSTRISTLTLAYFADSGWYQVDLSNADVASGWGRGAGCNFVNDTCINEFGDVPPQNAPFFCNEVSIDRIPGLSMAQNIHGCTPDLSRKARCSIGEYDLDLPKAYQYFNSTYGSKVGGSDTFMDFCPVYDGFDNGLCSSPESGTVIRANKIEQFGLRNSRCLVGNVYPFYRNTALCLPIACVLEDRTLRVKVGEEWHICEHADKTIESETVKITCPDPRRICPTFFCPYDCLGTGGECDYESGKCLCRYENATHPEETFLDVCGMVEEIEESETRNTTRSTTTLRPILQRKGKIDLLMPPADTKISDYYVSDVYHLDAHPRLLDAWGVLILIITAMVLVSFFVVLFFFRKPLMECTTITWNIIRFWKRSRSEPRGDDGIGIGGSIHGQTRDKHKMVASVLVDMRIRQNDNDNSTISRWRRRRTGRRDPNESLAETEGRMTDSEIDSSAAAAMSDSLSEVSSRQMIDESMSDFDGDDNEINDSGGVEVLEEEPSLLPQDPQIIRRRRFVS